MPLKFFSGILYYKIQKRVCVSSLKKELIELKASVREDKRYRIILFSKAFTVLILICLSLATTKSFSKCFLIKVLFRKNAAEQGLANE